MSRPPHGKTRVGLRWHPSANAPPCVRSRRPLRYSAVLDWSKPPIVLWQHIMKAKPDATVHATVGGHPAILTRPFSKGQVCFVTIAPLVTLSLVG